MTTVQQRVEYSMTYAARSLGFDYAGDRYLGRMIPRYPSYRRVDGTELVSFTIREDGTVHYLGCEEARYAALIARMSEAAERARARHYQILCAMAHNVVMLRAPRPPAG